MKSRLLPLQGIETRHRKLIQPVLAALTSAIASGFAQLQSSLYEDAVANATLKEQEKRMIRAGVELRAYSRDVVDGNGVLNAKRLVEEFERRE